MKNIKHNGFTLIELIVVITIIVVLSGVSLSSYFRFSQRQLAKNDARNFSTTLRRVQAMAKNLVYPVGCTGLSGYQLYTNCTVYSENCQSVNAKAICLVGGTTPVINDEKVLEKAFFSGAISVTFLAGSGSIDTPGEFPIQNSGDDFTVVVKMDNNGNISTKEYESYP